MTCLHETELYEISYIRRSIIRIVSKSGELQSTWPVVTVYWFIGLLLSFRKVMEVAMNTDIHIKCEQKNHPDIRLHFLN